LPDHNLREHILKELSRQWIRVTPEAKHDVVAGMIRCDELELAQEQIAVMQEDNVAIQPWLNVLMVHKLCEKKDFDALLRLAYNIHDNRKELPRSTWLFLLQQASGQGDYHLTEWIWLHHVEPMYIRPDTQSCVNTLKLAAQEGKPKLTESAWGVMEVIDPEAAAIHHHLLISAYEKAGVARNPSLARGSEVFAAFSRGPDHNKAFFDPKLAIDKRISGKMINPARLERSRAYKQSLKSAQKRENKLKRQGR
jgi:hypothetical protein